MTPLFDRRLYTLCAFWAAVGLLPAAAHGPLGERLLEATQKIARQADSADLWIYRAELHRLDGNFRLAAGDLARAAALEPKHRDLPIAGALVELALERPQAALLSLDATGDSRDPVIHALRGQALLALGDSAAAATAFLKIEKPEPDLALRTAELLQAAGREAEALGYLADQAPPGAALALRVALAESLARQGRVEEGLEILAEAGAGAKVGVFWKLSAARLQRLAGCDDAARTTAEAGLTELRGLLERGRLRPSAYSRATEAEFLVLARRWAEALAALQPGEAPALRITCLDALGRAHEARTLRTLLDQQRQAAERQTHIGRQLHEIAIRSFLEKGKKP